LSSDTDLQKRLGARCRELRHKRGLSLMDVVKEHDISLSHLQKIERGVLDPRVSTLQKLADAYDVTLAGLLRGV
jgi:transcriptional regulator with XRE-family HTH domain